MAFNDTYRESIQSKHLGNVGFSSTAKGVTNEAYAVKNPHNLNATQIPIIDVVSTYGPLVASGIAAGKVEEHIVQLTADPTVNGNKAWLAYETNCTTHSGTRSARIDSWLRVAETEYKLRVFADNGSGAPNYSSEILPSETNFNWDYDHTAGIVYFDADPTTYFTGPLWGKVYTYVGEFLSDKIDTTVSGAPVSDSFMYISDGTNTATADGSDTLAFYGSNGLSVVVDSGAKSVTISGAPLSQRNAASMTYNAGNWDYNGSLSSVPSDLEVYYNGVLNKNDADYYTATVSGGVLTVDFSFDTYSDDWVQIMWGGEYTASGLLRDWVLKTSAYTLVAGDRIIVDTDGNPAYNLTLPAAPVSGDTVSFFDGGGNCGTVNVTILRNGNNVMGLAQDLAIDTDNASFDLVYYNASKGWRIVE